MRQPLQKIGYERKPGQTCIENMPEATVTNNTNNYPIIVEKKKNSLNNFDSFIQARTENCMRLTIEIQGKWVLIG